MIIKIFTLLLSLVLITSCTQESADQTHATKEIPAPNPERNAYFGDLHVHTTYSFDAYIFGTRATPDDAYRFAKGGILTHPAGFKMQLDEPLDFYSVTDHGVFLGVIRAMADKTHALSKHPDAKTFLEHETPEETRAAFAAMRPYLDPTNDRFGEISDHKIIGAAWSVIQDAANRHNDPGRFTAFIGYEYTSGPRFQNLHRNVIYKGNKAPGIPFSRVDSPNPEDLWQWMDKHRANGIESLAIPHNSNGSNGQMFKLVDYLGQPLDAAYAELRMRNEPLVENTQVKGTSDTHPLLSPNDEWADFEIMPFMIATTINSDVPGSYVREALMHGIEMESQDGFNPYKFGVIGSSDTHNASWTGNDDNYWGKVAHLDSTPAKRGTVPLEEPNGSRYADNYYTYWGGSGLAGVWAEKNTRDAIYEAFRRKETFSTTGPRIKVRFFGGSNLPDLDSPNMLKQAYASGVAMGGDMTLAAGQSPEFIIWATRDTRDASLQRAQIIKGWIENGVAKEQVYDVACSSGFEIDQLTHRCPDNGASVDITSCSPSGIGAAELQTRWTDPDFNPKQGAFYYVRVLQNPTCRWSTWDAIRSGVAPREGLQATIQERAWSSPIWYTPGG